MWLVWQEWGSDALHVRHSMAAQELTTLQILGFQSAAKRSSAATIDATDVSAEYASPEQ